MKTIKTTKTTKAVAPLQTGLDQVWRALTTPTPFIFHRISSPDTLNSPNHLCATTRSSSAVVSAAVFSNRLCIGEQQGPGCFQFYSNNSWTLVYGRWQPPVVQPKDLRTPEATRLLCNITPDPCHPDISPLDPVPPMTLSPCLTRSLPQPRSAQISK